MSTESEQNGATPQNLSFYLGYKNTARARKEYLESKRAEAGLPSINALIHNLIVEKFPDYPKNAPKKASKAKTRR